MTEDEVEFRFDPPSVTAVNKDGRVLFRINTESGTFSVFRSSRMTQLEKEFIKAFYGENIAGADLKDMQEILDYQSEGDILCS